MTMTDNRPRGEVPCSYHPGVTTGLRCSRCGKPICPRCGVRTPVGLRCPDCAGVRGLPTYQTKPTVLAKAAGIGLLVAVIVAFLWRLGPEWGFYLSLVLGFGVAESMAWVSNAKRGRDLQLAGLAIVAAGLVLSRVFLAQRYGISLAAVNDLNPVATFFLRLRFIPDVLYAILPFIIVWIRFR